MEKVKRYLKKLEFYWKDNKIIAIKYLFEIIKCGILKPYNLSKTKKEELIFQKAISGKKELIKEIPYNEKIKSKIILPTGDTGLTKDLILKGIREPTEVKLFIKEVKSDMNIIDIGANLGYYVLLEGNLTKGKIYGIEPNPNAIKYLKRSIKLNGYRNIILFNRGINDSKKILPFYISKKWNWSRFDNPGEDIIETKKILTDSLDNMFGDKKIDLIRMDVEGYELNILKGVSKIIERNPNLILFLEFHGNMFNTLEKKEFIKWINENNFKIRFLGKSGEKHKIRYKYVNPKRIINLNSAYCLVLKKQIFN